MKHPQKDFPISELRIVRLHFWGDKEDFYGEFNSKLTSTQIHRSVSKHMMHKSQVEKFIEASLKLHHSPGINPHIKNRFKESGELDNKTAKLEYITIQKLDLNGRTLWWCMPSLGVKGESKDGAIINDPIGDNCAWIHPDSEEDEDD